MDSDSKPHAVCIPFPAQGHINPMTKLAKILHHKGFHITFVHTEYNYKRLLKAHGSLIELPRDFVFKTIPDGLPPPPDENIDAIQDIPDLIVSSSKNCLAPFRDLVADLNNTDSIPPVSCIVSDGVMTFTLQVAQELGVPQVLFWTTSACGFMGYLQFPRLVQDGIIPFKDISYTSNDYLETPVDWIPGVDNIRLRDLPSFIRTTDPNDPVVKFVIAEVERATKASAIILNTFDELEHDVLSSIRPIMPPVYTIGSLHMLLPQISGDELNYIRSNLWKEEPECLQWLDSKDPNSVVYVNFGSIAVITPQQMVEFAWGLANSNKSFLWVIRPDLVLGKDAILPSDFMAVTKERGLLASWCPQEQVLSHPSVCGFLTHSGWNSTLESVCSGVPMICWPCFTEQQMNCRYSCVHWGIGMEIESNVKREEVERLVIELMDGKKGEEMKRKAMEWKKKAEAAVAPGGSSYMNIDKLVREILVMKFSKVQIIQQI